MKKFVARLIISIIILPVLYLVIFVFTQLNYLALNIIILFFTITGAFEVKNFFSKANIPVFHYSAPILSASMSIITYLEITFFQNFTSLTYKWLILIFIFPKVHLSQNLIRKRIRHYK